MGPHELKPYQPAYLSGFKAQRYQIDPKEGFEDAKQFMALLITEDIRQDIGGDEQRIHQVATAYSAITFKHLLLPVWISAYRFQDRAYQVVVNAQNGGGSRGTSVQSAEDLCLCGVSNLDLLSVDITFSAAVSSWRTQP